MMKAYNKMKLFFLAFLLLPSLAFATSYDVMKDESAITFTATHAGNEFTGTFEDYTATIDYDSASPESTTAIVNFDIRSAKTGNKLYDGTLPSADWFDASNHPQAVFELTSMEKIDDNVFKATGDLTIRDITKPITFDFKLAGDPLTMTAELPINRLDYQIGQSSDANAEWVSETITVKINLKVTPSPNS